MRLLCAALLAALTAGAAEPVRWIAHRGGVVSTQFAENSPASLDEAARRDYWMIEVDVRESKDGKLVVQHDPDFERFYGAKRLVADMNWEEISKLRAKPGGTAPMTFRDLCRRAKGKLRLMIDTKEPSHGEAFYQEMESAMRENGLLESAYFIGTAESRERFRGKARVSATGAELRAALAEKPDAAREFFVFEWGSMSPETIAFARKHKVPVVPSINTFHYKEDPLDRGSADIRRLLKLGVTEFQIDSVYELAFVRPR